MDETKHDKQRPKSGERKLPKATKAQMAAVKKSAEEAGELLDREQEDSVMNLAQALDEINEGEALAHLDTRLSFIERQVERLTARREETDRGFQGELAIMRARIEDTLEAVGTTAEDQREAWISLEKRLSTMVTEQDTRNVEQIDSVRGDLIALIQEASAKLEKAEARVRGEARALESNLEERIRSVTEGVGEGKSLVEESLESLRSEITAAREGLAEALTHASSEWQESIGRTTEQIDARLAESLESQEKRAAEVSEEVNRKVTEATTQIDRATEDLLQKVASLDDEIDSRFAELGGSIEAKVDAFSGTVATLRSSNSELRGQVEALNSSLEERLDAAAREMQARVSESQADLRLELHTIKTKGEESLAKVVDLLELARRDSMEKIRASEEKAANAAIHLESLINQIKRQMVADEQEFSAVLTELVEDVNSSKIRIEEMAGRLASTEARRANERGSADLAVESVTGRMEIVEARLRELLEEVVAKHATRLDVLSSQVASITNTEVQAEERTGAVDYLSRKVAELTERMEEVATRTNQLARTPVRGSEPVSELPTQMSERIKVIETRLAALSSGPRQDPLVSGVMQRLEGVEKAVGSLTVGGAQGLESLEARLERLEQAAAVKQSPKPEPITGDLTGRVEAVERTITTIPQTLAARQTEILTRLDELERRMSGQPGQTILPDKRKRRW